VRQRTPLHQDFLHVKAVLATKWLLTLLNPSQLKKSVHTSHGPVVVQHHPALQFGHQQQVEKAIILYALLISISALKKKGKKNANRGILADLALNLLVAAKPGRDPHLQQSQWSRNDQALIASTRA
jgi:hypothetical protein